MIDTAFSDRHSEVAMPSVHFVEDYERHVAELMASHPLDEAMSLAVGGQYDQFGKLMTDILVNLGVRDGMSLVDLGCGSGRLAKYLGMHFHDLSYIGIDIVQALLDYAQKQCPAHFRFIKHQEVSIPVTSESADAVVAFSVFTHLLHEETYLYMSDARRVIAPGGKLIFSYLEFGAPHHWRVFEDTVGARKQNARYPLNMFIEQPVIRLWADKLDFKVESIGPSPLGQNLAVLSKN
jgi:ubiquinone/menaquinone biosynthesis C-methylase UbiE